MSELPGRGNRKLPRYEVTALVDITSANDLLLLHRIKDLALGGLCIQTPSIEEVGTRVDLVINFPDGSEPLAIEGEVVRVSREPPEEMGIRFVALSEEARERLKRLIFPNR